MISDDITLSNGLRVLTCRRDLGKSAAQLYIRAGLYHGHKPELAHILEHLQATPAGISDGPLHISYCESNATTAFDKSMYYYNGLVPEDFDECARALSNVLATCNTEVLEREKQAVIQELTPKDTPESRFYRTLQHLSAPKVALMYDSYDDRIASIPGTTADDCKRFFNEAYNPANAILILAGTLPEKLESIIEPFEALRSDGVRTADVTWPAQAISDERLVHTEYIQKVNAASIVVLKHAPNYPHTGTYREEAGYRALCAYLRNHRGPLHEELRNKRRLCYGFGVNLNESGPLTFLDFQATTSHLDRTDELIKAYESVLEDIAAKGIPEPFLDSHRKGLRIALLGEQHSFGISDIMDEAIYGLKLNDKIETYSTIQQEDVRAAALALAEQNSIIGISLPE